MQYKLSNLSFRLKATALEWMEYSVQILKKLFKSFQSNNGLATDGIVGPKTTAALTDGSGSQHSSGQTQQPAASTMEYTPSSPKAQEVSSNTSGIVSTAESLVGSPYKWGGTTPAGFDCSGFLNYVYQKAGISLPRTSNDIYKAGTPVSNPSPGDVVFFENAYGNYGSGYATHAGSMSETEKWPMLGAAV